MAFLKIALADSLQMLTLILFNDQHETHSITHLGRHTRWRNNFTHDTLDKIYDILRKENAFYSFTVLRTFHKPHPVF